MINKAKLMPGITAFCILSLVHLSAVNAQEMSQRVSRIAFGSCFDPARDNGILRKVIETRPDIFIFTGDNIYADTHNPRVMERRYDNLAANADFRDLRGLSTVLATWDDHDYGKNDAGADYQMKSDSEKIFENFWDYPADSPVRTRPGIYSAFLFGPEHARVQIILLDTRYFRSALARGTRMGRRGPYGPSDESNATILGGEQWKWLAEQLAKQAKVRIIVSSIQVLAEFHGWESWSNFPGELEKLKRLFVRNNVNGVLFVSGDRHFSEISRETPQDFYPLVDITVSGLNRRYPDQTPTNNSKRIGNYYLNHNFGYIDILWELPDPEIHVRIVDANGDVVMGHELQLSDLEVQ